MRAIGDAEEPRLRMAREIAAAGVLVAAFGSGGVTAIVLSWKLAELLGGRPDPNGQTSPLAIAGAKRPLRRGPARNQDQEQKR